MIEIGSKVTYGRDAKYVYRVENIYEKDGGVYTDIRMIEAHDQMYAANLGHLYHGHNINKLTEYGSKGHVLTNIFK